MQWRGGGSRCFHQQTLIAVYCGCYAASSPGLVQLQTGSNYKLVLDCTGPFSLLSCSVQNVSFEYSDKRLNTGIWNYSTSLASVTVARDCRNVLPTRVLSCSLLCPV